MSSARCPRCATPTLVPGHEVHVCTGCGGVWLDAERARRLLAPLGADLQPSAAPQTAAAGCPVCGQGMYICLTRLAGVEIDVCGPHGAWFDRHELERVSQAVSRITGQPLPSAPPGWVQAQPPASHGTGPGPWAGAAMTGVGVGVGAVAYATLGGDREEAGPPSSFEPVDALSVAPDVVSAGADVAASTAGTGDVAYAGVAMAGDAAGSVADVAGDAAEAAGSILGSIFDAIGNLFS